MADSFFQYPLYWASRRTVMWWMQLKFRLRIEGSENIPDEGPVILAANHCSYLDPPVISMCSRRRVVRFMARDSLFSNTVARWYFPRIGVIPLDRTRGDVGALRTAVSILRGGHMIGLFPEGTRSPDGQIHEAKGGIGFLIAKGNAPVVPIHLTGTFEAFPKGSSRFHPSRVSARVGIPISPEELRAAMPVKGEYGAVGALVMERIRALAPAAALLTEPAASAK